MWADMKELAHGVWMLDGFPPDLLNVYLIEDVLIDSATRHDEGRIMRQLMDRPIAAHALTHAHPDHLGSSHAICSTLDIPFWVGELDAPAAADTDEMMRRLVRNPFTGGEVPSNPLVKLFTEVQSGPGHPVARRLRAGDEVAGFTVLDVPGHTEGHIAFWRESDGVLVAGDVLWNFHFVGSFPGLTEPLALSCNDPARNRESARALAALEPKLVCFGHGPPLRDTARFVDFVGGLAQD
jgi:glyoxylase-like metal-dependent hydrolase (beta-lactamase superfamily II)